MRWLEASGISSSLLLSISRCGDRAGRAAGEEASWVPIPDTRYHRVLGSSQPGAWPYSSSSKHPVLLKRPSSLTSGQGPFSARFSPEQRAPARARRRPVRSPADGIPHPRPRTGAGRQAAYPVLQFRGELGLELAASATAVVSLNENLPGHWRLLRPHGEDRTGHAAGSGDTNRGSDPGLDSELQPASTQPHPPPRAAKVSPAPLRSP